MNKLALKKFAIKAREDLIQQVERRANIFGIDKNTELKVEEKHGQLAVNGKIYPINKKKAFKSLNRELKAKGYVQLIEEVAYTWFNRIIAIRYMEVNEYLPKRVNVLSSSTGKAEPDILLYYETMELEIQKEEIANYIRQGKNEEAYRKLFIAQCNALYEILPFLFEKIDDYTELLLPDFLLDSESVINNLVNNQDLTESFQVVEVIGWLYQYYNSQKKIEFEELQKKKKLKVDKYNIPTKTQLFTTKWIVEYMVQNSLGRYWVEMYPESRELTKNWKYYICEDIKKEEDISSDGGRKSIEDIRCIDPAMGSGHILLYTFDVLYEIYSYCGYMEREIPKLIIENNLYGLEIDDRAYQLACFSIIMKAQQYNSRFLRYIEKKVRETGEYIKLNLASIQESNVFSNVDIDYLKEELNVNISSEFIKLLSIYKDAKTYGSLISENDLDHTLIENQLRSIKEDVVSNVIYIDSKNKLEHYVPMYLLQNKIINSNYDIVIMNPPYLGKKKHMNDQLSSFVEKNYPLSKYDLFSAFIERGIKFKSQRGYLGLMTPQSWMFLSSYSNLRSILLNNVKIESLVQCEESSFEDAAVAICTFVLGDKLKENTGTYLRLTNFKGSQVQPIKVKEAINKDVPYKFIAKQEDFFDFPDNRIIYWIDKSVFNSPNNINLGEEIDIKQGMATSDNDRFLRRWFEVELNKIGFNYKDVEELKNAEEKWFPYNKGGERLKWYGNREYVLNYENDGYEVKEYASQLYGSYSRTVKNISFFFKESITWSDISGTNFAARYSGSGFIFDVKGSSAFPKTQDLNIILGLMNSKILNYFINVLNPSVTTQVGDLKQVPFFKDIENDLIKCIVDECIEIAKIMWDSSEFSWDFRKDPLIGYKNDRGLLEEAFYNKSTFIQQQFKKLKKNQEELNRIFIKLYELEDELTPEVNDEEINISKPDRLNDAKSYLSYFIGCVMGRYSLDVDGLVYAGGEWDESKYQTFKPNKYGIILLTDKRYFEDDIITRLREFLKAAFGSETVEENLKWIAESLDLKRGETAEERLRRYFIDEFFNDHSKVYQKRPIYWLVDSGKQKGLRTLVYMHRYEPATMATIRFEHLQEIQGKYHNEITAIETRLSNTNLSASEKRELDKKKDSYKKKLDELIEFDKYLATYANQQINIDLDDGVKINYAKFDKVLAKLK